jgi:type I restriction enzyme S subunit
MWQEYKLGDVLDVKHGFAFLGEHFSNEGTHIVLTPGNFFDDGGFKRKEGKDKWYRGTIPSQYILGKGDLVVAMTEQAEGLLGSAAIIPANDLYLHNQRIGLVLPKHAGAVDKVYAYYLFNSGSVRQQIRASASGTKIRHTAPSRIADVEVTLPPLPIQKRIAGILSAYDDLIENSQRRIKILEEMSRRLYREWFVHFRFPGHEGCRFVESPLGEIPEGWEVNAFTEIAEVLSGGTPKTDVPQYWNGEIPFFTPRDAPDCFYLQDTEKHVSDIGLSKCASALYPPDTVFITARGTVGKVALPAVNMAVNQSCYALRGKTGIPQRFLFLMTLQQVDYLKTNTGGATFDTIVVDTFRRMEVVSPSQAIASQFSELIDPVFEQVNTLQRQIQNLRRTRDLLLPRLLSGQLDVEALPEPALMEP